MPNYQSLCKNKQMQGVNVLKRFTPDALCLYSVSENLRFKKNLYLHMRVESACDGAACN